MKISGIWKRMVTAFAAGCILVGMAGCGSGGNGSSGGTEAYKDYVIGIMDANYLAKYEKYMEITGSVQAEAEKIYEANILNFSMEIEDALSVKKDVVSRNLAERFVDMAGSLYSQVKYQAVDVVREGDIYTVSVEIEPIDFFGTVQDPFQSAVDEFNAQAKSGAFDGYTDAEYEEAYGVAVANALEANIKNVSYGSKITVDVVLDYDKENHVYFISDEQMEGLDDKVVKMVR